MKKKVLITLTFVLFLLAPALQPAMAYAETTVPSVTQPAPPPVRETAASTEIPPVLDVNGKTVNPGTLPDSTFYWLSNLIQKLQVVLTFDPVQKATLDENQALQKLAAARVLIQKGKPELAQQSLSEYSRKIQGVQEFIEKLKDPNSTTAELLQKAMAQTDASNIQVLSGLLEKLPPKAAEKLAVNIVKSMQKAVDNMTDEQKKVVEAHLQETEKYIDPSNPDAQVEEAVTKLRTSLGLKSSAYAEAQKGKNDENNDNDRDNGDNDGDNTVLLNEDPNQPVSTLGEEKKTAALKKTKTQDQEKDERQGEQQEQQDAQDNKDSSKMQENRVVPAQVPTIESPVTPSPVSKERATTGRDNGGKGNNKDHNEDQNKD